MTLLMLILSGYAVAVVCWVLYLAIMNLSRVRQQLHPFAKFNAYCIILPVGYVFDAVLNLIACALFMRVPRDWLLTGTLQRIRNTEPFNSWREKTAAWICTHLLNQFDPKGRHC